MKILERQPSEKARSYAIRVLLYNITALELPPGSSVSENEVSSVMNISRTPVREALIELSRMDLVDILPKRGSFISKIDYGLIEESRFMRLVLETAIVKLACEQGISSYYMELLGEKSPTGIFSVQYTGISQSSWSLTIIFISFFLNL